MEAQTDAHILLKVFPAEVWCQTFQNLETIRSYQNIFHSSPFFYTLPIPEQLKTGFIFSRVLPNLLRYLKRSKEAYLEYLDLDEEEAEKLSENGCILDACFNYSEILKLRKICRGWRNGVDFMLEEFGRPFQFTYSRSSPVLGHKYLWFEKLWRETDFHIFEQKFDETHYAAGANPFVARSLYLRLESKRERNYATKSLQFLEKYGNHVWYCVIDLYVDQEECLNVCYQWVSDALKHLPNIQTISINSWYHNNNRNERKNKLANLQQYAQQNPIQKMKKLTSVKIYGDLEPVGIAVISSNPQITILKKRNISDCLDVLLTLKNLTQLEVTLNLGHDLVENYLRNLKASPTVWQMKKLDISFGTEEVSWQLLFEALEHKFGETLKELRLWLPTPKVFDNSARLFLPNLECLNVCGRYYTTLDFILPMRPHLCKLFVEMGLDESFCKAEWRQENLNVIQFYECRFELFRCNIWEMFPKMNQILYSEESLEYRGSCLRSEWRDYVAKLE